MLDLCLCEESKACCLIYNMIICSLLFWILVSSRTFHKLIICTVSLILETYWLGYATFKFRNINIVSISLLEGSSLIFQHTCIKHGNAEVPRILGFAMECFTDWLKTLFKRLYRAWGSFRVLPLWRRIHTKVTVIFPLLSVTFPRWLFPFLRKQRSFSVEGIKLQFLLYKTKMLLFQMAIDEIVIHHIFELSSSLHFAVHSGSIGGIFLDYTASQFLSVYKKEAGANRMPID